MRKKKHYSEEAIRSHLISMELLDYLCPIAFEKYDKVSAYRDLLNRACKQPQGNITRLGQTLLVSPGQLVVAVSTLATVWKWHRVTTTDFLKDLENLGILTMESHTKFFVLTFNGISGMIADYTPQDGETTDETREEEADGVAAVDKAVVQEVECQNPDMVTMADECHETNIASVAPSLMPVQAINERTDLSKGHYSNGTGRMYNENKN